jgi:hypothetical protein
MDCERAEIGASLSPKAKAEEDKSASAKAATIVPRKYIYPVRHPAISHGSCCL